MKNKLKMFCLALALAFAVTACDTGNVFGGTAGSPVGGSGGNTSGGNAGGNTGGATVKAPAAPSSVLVTGFSDTAIFVSWFLVPGADKYNVYYSTSAAGSFSLGDTTPLTYTYITGLNPNTRYYVRITAVNSAGEGPYAFAFGSTPVGF